MDDLSTIVKLGIVAIGLMSVVGLALIGIVVVWRLTQHHPCPPDPVRAVQPVPDTTEQPQDTLHIVGRNEFGRTG